MYVFMYSLRIRIHVCVHVSFEDPYTCTYVFMYRLRICIHVCVHVIV